MRRSGRGLPPVLAGDENLELVLPTLSDLAASSAAMASMDARGPLFSLYACDSLFEAVPWLGILFRSVLLSETVEKVSILLLSLLRSALDPGL